MWCNEGNHFPAVIETTTGRRGRQFDHPTLGAWVSLRSFRRIGICPRLSPWDEHRRRSNLTNGTSARMSGIRGSSSRGRASGVLVCPCCCSSAGTDSEWPCPPPRTGSTRYAINTDIAAKSHLYELADAASCPSRSGLFEGAAERSALYGIGERETDDFARQRLLADAWWKMVCDSSRSAAAGGNGAWRTSPTGKRMRRCAGPRISRRRASFATCSSAGCSIPPLVVFVSESIVAIAPPLESALDSYNYPGPVQPASGRTGRKSRPLRLAGVDTVAPYQNCRFNESWNVRGDS